MIRFSAQAARGVRAGVPFSTWRGMIFAVPALALAGAAPAQFVRTDLVSDQLGLAAHMDPNLTNAWGIAFNPTGFVWVANNHSSTSTLYDGLGNPQTLVVNIPAPTTPTGGAPTGMVFNNTTGFVVTQGAQTGPAGFIWATEDGTIAAWNPTVGSPPTPSTSSFVVANRSPQGAIYKGLTMATNAGVTRLIAADFHNGRVDVFNNDFSFNPTASTGFADPTIPAGYAPFNAKTIGNKVYITYAKQDAGAEDDVPGAGFGYINIFNTDGTLDHRLASGGSLNAPWGMALAPANFGVFSNDLLVGNFGSGTIQAYNPTTGQLLGSINGTGGITTIDGLWGLEFGNGVQNQPTSTLFFTAGPGGEAHGLYGSITAPSPAAAMLALPGACLMLSRRRR